VLQVRWNNGSAIAESPRIFLRALPFQPSGKAFTGTLALSLLALWAIKAQTGAIPAGNCRMISSVGMQWLLICSPLLLVVRICSVCLSDVSHQGKDRRTPSR
jgi:hypothetical protein